MKSLRLFYKYFCLHLLIFTQMSCTNVSQLEAIKDKNTNSLSSSAPSNTNSSSSSPTTTPSPAPAPTPVPVPSPTPSPTPSPMPSPAPAPNTTASINSVYQGEWYEAPNTVLSKSSVDPCPTNDCTFSGGNKLFCVMDCWSGGAYDSTRDRLIIWGGGHGGYYGNELYAFDVTNMNWLRLTNPTILIEGDLAPPNTTSYYHDGKPSSRHTYNSLQYFPELDSFFSLVAAATAGGDASAGASHAVDSFNFKTNTWKSDWLTIENGVDLAGNKANDVGGTMGSISAYDENLKVLWLHTPFGSGKLGKFNPLDNSGKGSWTIYNDNANMQYYGTAAIDTKRNLMISIGGYSGRQMILWDLNNPNNNVIIPSTTGDSDGIALESAQAPGFVYDSDTDQFIGWNGGTKLYSLKAPANPLKDTWTWTAIIPSATNKADPGKPAQWGTYGRFRYVPSKKVFILVNTIDSNVFFYKLKTN